MAGSLKKITELPTGTPLDTDVIPFVDLTTGTTKKATKTDLKGDKGDTGAKGDTGSTGAAGTDGEDAFAYIAYASDSSGTDFTTTFDADLDYIAIKSTTTEIATPSASDFTGLWKNYKGATGATGTDGDDAYVYIAYASDSSGTDFTTTFDSSLDYIAIKHTTTAIASPAASDFTGLWKNYKGAAGTNGTDGSDGAAATITVGTVTTGDAGTDATVTNSGTTSAAVFDFTIPKGADGTGTGDMLASTYDPNSIASDAFDQDNMVDGTTNKNYTATEKTKLAGIASGAEVNAVDSVNTQTGSVVLDADDIDDTSTTNKFVTATDITNLGNLSGTNTGDQDLSGYGLKSGKLSQFAATSSSELAGVISDETGSGALVFATKPTFIGTIQTITAVSALALDGSLGNMFTKTIATGSTFTQSNFSTGQNFTLTVTGAFTITWFSTITWITSGGTAPTQGAVTTYGFTCTGTNTFLGYLVGTQ